MNYSRHLNNKLNKITVLIKENSNEISELKKDNQTIKDQFQAETVTTAIRKWYEDDESEYRDMNELIVLVQWIHLVGHQRFIMVMIVEILINRNLVVYWRDVRMIRDYTTLNVVRLNVLNVRKEDIMQFPVFSVMRKKNWLTLMNHQS